MTAHKHEYVQHPRWAGHYVCGICGFAAPKPVVERSAADCIRGAQDTWDPTPGLRGRARLVDLVSKQQRWIERCERNGKSYAGPNGPAIRAADQEELRRLERLLHRQS